MRIFVTLLLIIYHSIFLNCIWAEDFKTETNSADNRSVNKNEDTERTLVNSKILFNGIGTSKQVTGITFNDNTTTLTWSDNTTMTGKAAESLISMALTDDAEMNIDKIKIFVVGGIYSSLINVSGIDENSDYCIFNMKQRKVMEGKTDSPTTTINISELNTGVYYLKSNRTIVKFTIGLNNNILSKK